MNFRIAAFVAALTPSVSGALESNSRECQIRQISGDGTLLSSGTIVLHGKHLLLSHAFPDGGGRVEELLECWGPREMAPHTCSGVSQGWSVEAEVVGTFADPQIIAAAATKIEGQELQVLLHVFEVSDCIDLSRD